MPSEHQLSNVLSEFARTMVTDFPIQRILDELVLRIVDILPITAAGVTLIEPGISPRYLAASNAAALRFEQLQTELGEGPCLAAYTTGDVVAVPDLREERRFPRFASRALAAGLRAVFTFPLRGGDARLGALDLYRDSPGPLDPDAMRAAQTLADVAAAYLRNAQARADLQDSSDRSRAASRHDALTGLPNRSVLLERLEYVLLRGRSTEMVAVLFVDLDEFKMINDMHGHRVGDELLVAVANRLTTHLRPGDTLARLCGDEFVILCDDLSGQVEVDAIAARISAALAESFSLSSGDVHTTASIGIALATRGNHLAEELLHDADLAMYQAKRKGGARHQLIDPVEQRQVDQRAILQRDLHRAYRGPELRMEYQPIVRTVDGRIVGVEALLRWEHPSRGPVSPSMLIPLAERTGLITEIGQWVLEHACRDLRSWRDHHQTDDLGVSVNVSAYQLMSPEFTATVEDVLHRTDTAPGLLTLEVTESVFVRDSHRALLVLNDLKHLGVNLALDDFGTGYSSLSYLNRFPVDIVKIDACQGYYFARPMPAEAFDALMGQRVAGANPRLPVLASAS